MFIPRQHLVWLDPQTGLKKAQCGIIFPALAAGCRFLIFKKNPLYFSLPPDKRLNSKEERRQADPAYEIMESRPPERNSEVGQSRTR